LETSTACVTDVDPTIPLAGSVAVSVMVPGDTAVPSPTDPVASETLKTVESGVAHVEVSVRSWVGSSVYVPVRRTPRRTT